MMIRRVATQGYETDQYDGYYDQVMLEEPEIPLLPKLKYVDITAEALRENSAKESPSTRSWSDEAGIFLSSTSMRKDNTKCVALIHRVPVPARGNRALPAPARSGHLRARQRHLRASR